MNIVDIFSNNVRLYADRVAVVDADGEITYRELENHSNTIAHILGNPYPTILLLPRRHWFHEAAFGVLKSGGCIVFASPEYPADRIRFIIQDCGAKNIITTSHCDRRLELLDTLPADGKLIEIDTLNWDKENSSPIPPLIDNNQDAFILYTSGTTGNPKGVVHTVESMTRMACANWNDEKGKDTIEKSAVVADLSFIASLLDLYHPLMSGGTCYIVDENTRLNLTQLSTYLSQHLITNTVVGASLGVELLKDSSLKLGSILLVGEKLTAVTPEMFRKTKVFNGYGASECGHMLAYRVNTEVDVIPVGTPSDTDDRTYILDNNRNPVPDGQKGELYISSRHIAVRYQNLPELSAEHFLQDPFRPDYRMLRTCDIAYKDQNGQIVLCGRADNMFKFHGFRIEPGEIENVASAFPCVGSCACVKKAVNGDESLCLYFEATEQINLDDLKAFMQTKLTHYMIPQRFVQMEKLPRNARGKIDRRSLPEPLGEEHTMMIPPANDKESVLYEIATKILGRRDFGVTDNLFDLGMTSLMSMKMVAEADCHQIKLKVGDVMRLKTIREILQDEMRLMNWFNGYDASRDTVIFVNGIMLAKNVEEKHRLWSEHFNLLTIESIQDHYDYIFQEETIDDVVAFYLDLLEVYLPDEARVRVFTGCSFGGKLAYLMAERWSRKTGQKPIVVMGDAVINSIPSLDSALLSGTVDAWLEKNPRFQPIFNPDFIRRMFMITHLERFGVRIPHYEGEVILYHALVSPFPGDNSQEWKKYASRLIVLPSQYRHDAITVDSPETLPVWKAVCDTIASAVDGQTQIDNQKLQEHLSSVTV